MRYRCSKPYNTSYSRYGGRGIKVCEEWNNLNNGFTNFEKWSKEHGYEEHLTIDRVDNNGDYEPKNCRWVEMKIQCRNKETSRRLFYNGESLQINDFAEKYNLTVKAIEKRIKNGWSIERIANTPIKHQIERTVPFGGKAITLRELSENTGFNLNTIKTWYRRGCLQNKIEEYTNEKNLK
jgi:hypothetical protein